MNSHRVFIIHDSRDVAESLREALDACRIQSQIGADPKDVLKKAGSGTFDLILVGQSLPRIDGFEICKRIKDDESLRGLPVVILDSEKDSDRRIEAFDRGAIDYLVAPYNFAEVGARIRAILRQRESDLRTGAETRDPVTGCLNRRSLDAVLEVALGKANFGVTSFLLYLDLDNFAIVNELAGQAAGDRLLKDVANILRSNTRPMDAICRMGSDEFTLVLEGVDESGATQTATRLRHVLDNLPFVHKGRSFPVSASIGIAGMGECSSSEDALNRAQSACRQIKVRGGNGWEVLKSEPPEQTQLSMDTEWFVRVKDALKEHRMEIWLQPIVPLRKDLNLFFEELIRMREPDGELCAPEKFLSAAERFGKAQEIDQLVLTKGLELLANHSDVHLSINLAARTFNDAEWPDWAERSMVDSGVHPSRITFEITETTVIQDLKRAQHIMERLREIGCRFALDDFGVGVSSLRYLRDLPVDIVKIDGGFVETIDTDPVNKMLVKSINDVAHSLGKLTVAEYVVSESVLHAVQDLEIDFAQGQHIGRASPPTEVLNQDRYKLAASQKCRTRDP